LNIESFSTIPVAQNSKRGKISYTRDIGRARIIMISARSGLDLVYES